MSEFLGVKNRWVITVEKLVKYIFSSGVLATLPLPPIVFKLFLLLLQCFGYICSKN